MKNKRVQQVVAFVLVLTFVLCGTVTVFAAPSSEEESSTLSSIKELLNSLSYNDYVFNSDAVKTSEKGHEKISLEGMSGVYTDITGNIVEAAPTTETDPDLPREYVADGETGLYIPDKGTVTWSISGKEFGFETIGEKEDKMIKAQTFNIEIRYYPVARKSAAIERTFKINGEIPFSEARRISISKVWKTPYPFAKIEIGKKQNAASVEKEAKDAGFKEASVITDDKGKTFVQVEMPSVWDAKKSAFVEKYTVRYFTTDIDRNEIRDGLEQKPQWETYTFSDSNGFVQVPFVFAMEPYRDGNVTLSLEGVNEPIVISEINLIPADRYESNEADAASDKEADKEADVDPSDKKVDANGIPSYSEYKKALYGTYQEEKAKYPSGEGSGSVKIEAEYFSAVSDQTIYPIADNTSAANSPSATDRTVYNTIGGGKWQSVGQWIEYEFTVPATGRYNILLRSKQNVLDGMSVSRSLYLYSDPTSSKVTAGQPGYYDGIPFEEASRMKFQYSNDWKVTSLAESFKSKEKFEFYFVEGVTYRMRLEVSLGDMGDLIRRVQESLDTINAAYLNILKITGTDPDEYVTYNFYQKIPQTMSDMYDIGTELKNIEKEIREETGEKSSMTATLESVSDLLIKMSSDEAEVAKNMDQLKTYIGSLGTWLGNAKTQPLLLDYIMIQPPSAPVPKAEANFFQAIWHELVGFFQSFWRKYDRMGALTETSEEESIEVWLAYGRDQSQVIRNLINNDFTSQQNVAVNLKLVAPGTLLPSILAGKGPDVYLGLAAGDVINYAIRGALVPVDDMEGYEEVKEDFQTSAITVLEIAKQNETEPSVYGLPETQSFTMMFVREDILANLDIEIPKTWDDVKEAIPKLQANNMEIAMTPDSNIFIYQSGGDLFADGGMRVNLDAPLVQDAFEDMCEMFTMYSFPYKYDFANRFRTGEMPIGFADYTGTYNQLKVFATELEGLWSFYELPGIEDPDTKEINNQSVSVVTAVVMITSKDAANDPAAEKVRQEKSWKFMKWYVGAECQADYSNEMVAILGPSAKHPTANKNALPELPWTSVEGERVESQFENLAAIPNYPGAYIIARYTNFAFLEAYNDKANPKTSLDRYIDQINDEITRKREEFGLEVLDKSLSQSTLAVKRMQEAKALMEKQESMYGNNAIYNEVKNDLEISIADGKSAKYENVSPLVAKLEALDAKAFKDAIAKLNEASECLLEYKKFEPQTTTN